jgi:hypothetical protein
MRTVSSTISVLVLGVSLGCSATGDPQAEGDVEETLRAIVGNSADFSEVPVANPVLLTGTRVRAIAVDGNRVYVGGNFNIPTGNFTYRNLVAFDISPTATVAPTLVTNFRPQPNDTVWAIAPDLLTVYVGGEFTSIGGQPRGRLAALDKSTGVANGTFIADVTGDLGCPTCTSGVPNSGDPGVHALALTPDETLVLGGNFTAVKGTTRNGLAQVSRNNGALYTGFTGVGGGFVTSLRYLSQLGGVFVAGTFTSILGASRAFLAMTDIEGRLVMPQTFDTLGQPVIDLDAEALSANGQVFAAVGGSGNSVFSFQGKNGSVGAGSLKWRGPVVHGDVQAVHYYNGAVYFGFHDGMWVDGVNGHPGDRFKLAAVNAASGALLVDRAHNGGVCDVNHQNDCFAPLADPTTGTAGFWGLWAIEHVVTSGATRLLVGGDVNQWGNGVPNTRLFAVFGPAM